MLTISNLFKVCFELLLFTILIQSNESLIISKSFKPIQNGLTKVPNSQLKSSSRLFSQSKDFIPDKIMPSEYTGPGCVLLAQPGEYDHFLMRAAVLIYQVTPEVTQGVILDKATAFSVNEMSPALEPFKGNTLFLGGNTGNDLAIMLHTHSILGSKYVGNGIYTGGFKQAKEEVNELRISPKDFKFVFNYIEWPKDLLSTEIASGRWDVCLLPPSLILRQSLSQNKFDTLWSQARYELRKTNSLLVPTTQQEDEA